jgi:hypothetical protein
VADFCEHCEGQRFDRAQVLRTLRRVRNDLRRQRCGKKVDAAIVAALTAVAKLELPHLEVAEYGDEVVH